VLETARWKSKLAVGEIVARLAPQPDVPTAIVPILEFAACPQASSEQPATPALPDASGAPPFPTAPAAPAGPPVRPTVLTPLSPRRYKLQLTISGETLEKLRRAKDLLGHAVPAGDDDAILNRALTVLLDKVERERCAKTDRPRPGRSRNPRARQPPAEIIREVWERDERRCRYTSPSGHRCEETRRVALHHLDPWALAGSPPTPEAYELRCQRHNDYEGRLYFGKRRRAPGEVHESPTPYRATSFSDVLVPEQHRETAALEHGPCRGGPRQTIR
jgi:hypothetical protein